MTQWSNNLKYLLSKTAFSVRHHPRADSFPFNPFQYVPIPTQITERPQLIKRPGRSIQVSTSQTLRSIR